MKPDLTTKLLLTGILVLLTAMLFGKSGPSAAGAQVPGSGTVAATSFYDAGRGNGYFLLVGPNRYKIIRMNRVNQEGAGRW